MTSEEATNINAQIINRAMIIDWILKNGPEDLKTRLCSLMEDNHQDSQELVYGWCVKAVGSQEPTGQ